MTTEKAKHKQQEYERSKSERAPKMNRGQVQSYIVRTFGVARREPGPDGQFYLEIIANGKPVFLRGRDANEIYLDAVTVLGYEVIDG